MSKIKVANHGCELACCKTLAKLGMLCDLVASPLRIVDTQAIVYVVSSTPTTSQSSVSSRASLREENRSTLLSAAHVQRPIPLRGAWSVRCLTKMNTKSPSTSSST